jgi:hypothetical protein
MGVRRNLLPARAVSLNTQPRSILRSVSLTITVINNSGVVLGTGDYTFQVAEPVPEPATVMLLSTVVGGLLAVRKRIRLR